MICPTVEQQWEEFVKAVYPNVAKGSPPYEGLKLSFYSGATSVLSNLQVAVSLPEGTATKALEGWWHECMIFGKLKLKQFIERN